MNNETAEPQILETQWEGDQVNQLFADLELGANVQHVQVKMTPAAGSEDRTVTLAEARDLFNRGEAKAIQIRYEFDGQAWCDTMMVGPMTHIIRTIQP